MQLPAQRQQPHNLVVFHRCLSHHPPESLTALGTMLNSSLFSSMSTSTWFYWHDWNSFVSANSFCTAANTQNYSHRSSASSEALWSTTTLSSPKPSTPPTFAFLVPTESFLISSLVSTSSLSNFVILRLRPCRPGELSSEFVQELRSSSSTSGTRWLPVTCCTAVVSTSERLVVWVADPQNSHQRHAGSLIRTIFTTLREAARGSC